ncbi:MAG: TipAS antibiotic-recognition domain-containing protein [Anaerolineae bacterium]|jgi:hypothetical protein|nr:TipAS antibiotic-recognition domain-containing protein [Anaerolineae bacterium]
MAKRKPDMFKPHSAAQQKQYERELRLEYGPTLVNESVATWHSYSAAQQQQIMAEGNAIYHDFADLLAAGVPAQDARVQAVSARWHQHLRYFYEPTLDLLRGLGDLYTTHPDFHAKFQALHPHLPAFLKAAIEQYVDALEYAAIARLLAEDEAQGGAGR